MGMVLHSTMFPLEWTLSEKMDIISTPLHSCLYPSVVHPAFPSLELISPRAKCELEVS